MTDKFPAKCPVLGICLFCIHCQFWTNNLVQCRIDKEKDLEGLVTDSSIETHEIPLRYDLFRERVLPELLQTVGDDILAEYVDKIPEIVSTVDYRHTTIVYRHEHLYHTEPNELYRKLRYYKWKFRSRRRRTMSTPEPSYTINAKDVAEIRNQVVETEEGESLGVVYTRNTLLVGEAFHPEKLHRAVIRRRKLDTALWNDDDPTKAAWDFIYRTFRTEFHSVRRLNRTVTFIPFHLGTWRTNYYRPLTTPYYLLPNYTLPSKWTIATDWENYDDVVYPYVTDREYPIPDEEKNRRRFSLSIVERIKQHENLEGARTLDTSYLKYIVKPYKYSTTPSGGVAPNHIVTSTTESYFPGYQMYITTPPWTTAKHFSGELVIRGAYNEKRDKVTFMKMNMDDNAFDMDMAFDYPVAIKQTNPNTNQPNEGGTKISGNFNPTCPTSRGSKSAESLQHLENTHLCICNTSQTPNHPQSLSSMQVIYNQTGSSVKDTKQTNNEAVIIDTDSHIDIASNQDNHTRVNNDKRVHRNIKKRSVTKNSEEIKQKNIKTNLNHTNTTKQTYHKFRSILLKRLNRKTVATKLTQKYTFKTQRISRRGLFQRKISTPMSYFTAGIKSTSKACSMVKTEDQEKSSQQNSTQGDRWRAKEIPRETIDQHVPIKVPQTNKGKHRKSTTQGFHVGVENGFISEATSKTKNLDKKQTCSTTKKKARRRLDKYEEILNQLYPPEENKDNSQDKTKKKLKGSAISHAHTTKRKKVTKSKSEKQREILYDLYPPVTDSGTRASIENIYIKNADRQTIQEYDELSNERPKKKPKKTKAERDAEFLNQLYPPVTLNEDWLREYESKLIPTVPHNMSRDDFIRGFYTFAPYEGVPSNRMENLGNCTPQNLEGYLPNDINLFSSQETVKLGGVINLYNIYAKEFLKESISTKKSRKKTTILSTVQDATLMEDEDVTTSSEYKKTRDWTRPYISCNWSHFIYY